SRSRDLFIVRLGTAAFLAKFGITGCLADVLGFFLRGLFGLALDKGIFIIDLGRDAFIEGLNREEFKKLAIPAYQKAKARLYTEEEKRAIREEFLAISRKFVRVGGVRSQRGS